MILCLLQKILVVTFTSAATRDLKIRIRSNIEQALQYLQSWQIQDPLAEQAPDYLKACMEKGEDAVKQARKRLQQAFLHLIKRKFLRSILFVRVCCVNLL